MLQANIVDCKLFDPFLFLQNGLTSLEVDIRRGEIVQVLIFGMHRSNVTRHPTAEWVARQITEAFPWDEAPSYLIRDRDSIFGNLVKKRLRAMGIRDRLRASRSPWQNAYAERLIGSIRRECVDHCIVINETHLFRLLRSYARYYNKLRTLQSLGKDSPISREIQHDGRIESIPILDGLHHHYVRI